MSKLPTFTEYLNEDLRNWFGKGKEGGVGGGGWDRYNTKGERIGKCGDAEDRGGEGEGKPKCLSTQKAAQLRAQGGKQAIANAVKRKKADDPVTDRPGTGNAPKMVSNRIEEENEPTNPSLWARAKAAAKQKFDVYPSAYANGWAAKWYKEHGGGWRTKKNEAYDDNVQTSTPADREWGTDSLVRIYKQMTPGQTDEAWERNPNCQQCRTKLSPAELKRGDRVCGKCVKQNKGRVWGKDSDDDYEEQMDLVPMRSVNEHIVKVKDGYRLVSKKTGKNLGTYPTKAGAEKRERQVQYFKHHESASVRVPSFKQFLDEKFFDGYEGHGHAGWTEIWIDPTTLEIGEASRKRRVHVANRGNAPDKPAYHCRAWATRKHVFIWDAESDMHMDVERFVQQSARKQKLTVDFSGAVPMDFYFWPESRTLAFHVSKWAEGGHISIDQALKFMSSHPWVKSTKVQLVPLSS